MEHFFHIFMPGTPENMALVQLFPALAPLQGQIAAWVSTLRTSIRS